MRGQPSQEAQTRTGPHSSSSAVADPGAHLWGWVRHRCNHWSSGPVLPPPLAGAPPFPPFRPVPEKEKTIPRPALFWGHPGDGGLGLAGVGGQARGGQAPGGRPSLPFPPAEGTVGTPAAPGAGSLLAGAPPRPPSCPNLRRNTGLSIGPLPAGCAPALRRGGRGPWSCPPQAGPDASSLLPPPAYQEYLLLPVPPHTAQGGGGGAWPGAWGQRGADTGDPPRPEAFPPAPPIVHQCPSASPGLPRALHPHSPL